MKIHTIKNEHGITDGSFTTVPRDVSESGYLEYPAHASAMFWNGSLGKFMEFAIERTELAKLLLKLRRQGKKMPWSVAKDIDGKMTIVRRSK